jgi:hypothetical protein
VINLDEYHVTGDDPLGGRPIVALTCDICSGGVIGTGDVATWETTDFIPSVRQLVAAAEAHEKTRNHAVFSKEQPGV